MRLDTTSRADDGLTPIHNINQSNSRSVALIRLFPTRFRSYWLRVIPSSKPATDDSIAELIPFRLGPAI